MRAAMLLPCALAVPSDAPASASAPALAVPSDAPASASAPLPPAFEPAGGGHFLARAPGGAARISPGGVVIAAHGARPVRLRAAGGARTQPVSAGARAPGVVNRLTGGHPRTGILLYRSVAQRGVYPGVDLVFHTRTGALEYDFVVRPGADPRRLRLEVDGARSLRLGRRGDLLIRTARGTLRQHRPVAYQRVGGVRRRVAARFVLRGERHVGFALGRHDPRRTLVVDPILAFSRYLGGTGDDQAEAVAADAAGNAFVVGRTISPDLPAAESYDPGCGTDGEASCDPYDDYTGVQRRSDVFVAKLGPDGAIAWLTYLGGSDGDHGDSIALGPDGAPTITGSTSSRDFPTTAGAYRTAMPADCAQSSCGSSFVARLAPDGRSLRWATYFDGRYGTWIEDLAVDAAGDVALVGSTNRVDFPTTLGALGSAGSTTPGRFDDGFVARLDTGGGRLEWSGRLAGDDDDEPWAVSLTPSGDFVVAGRTRSGDFPTTPAAAQRNCDGPGGTAGVCNGDGFVMRVPGAGTEPAYSSYLGGISSDQVDDLALDPDGRVLVSGSTGSEDFPAATDLTDGARGRVFAARLPAGGGAPEWSSLAGLSDAGFTSVAPAPSGDVYLAGTAYQPLSVPGVDAIQRVPGGGGDGFVMRIAAGGGSHRWSSWLGGEDGDRLGGIATVPGGLVVTGTTGSLDFPTRTAADTTLGDGACRDPRWCQNDAFVARITEAATRTAYDDFAQRRRLSALAGWSYADSAAATREAGEPAHAGAGGGRSLWFEWTAPVTRTVAFDTADSGIDTVLAVYSGSALGSLAAIAANDDAPGRTTSRVLFTARQGRTYKIAVDGKGGAGGLVRLGWEGAPPHNDDFLDAERISGESGTAGGSMVYATAQEGEPPGDYGDPLESIWYRWTAPATGVYVFSSAGSSVITGLDIYRGERVELLESRPEVLEAKAGLTYSIRLYPMNRLTGGDTGDAVLRWHRAPRPANDDLANAQPLTAATGSVSGETYAATAEAGEPAADYEHTVWYSFAPPAGTYELSLTVPYFENEDLYLYEGSTYADLKSIAVTGNPVRIGIDTGDRVLLSIRAYGAHELRWKPVDAPANDLFSRARALPAEGDELVATGGATSQPGESYWQESGVWFTWTAPASGPVSFSEGVAAFTGSSIRTLTPVERSSTRPFTSWTATAGTTYRIRVLPYDGPRRHLVWAFGRPANDDFASPRQLSGASGKATFSMAHATEQPGEPDTHASGTTWFSWTAPASGPVTLSTVGSEYAIGIDAYTGSQLTGLTWVLGTEYADGGYTGTFQATAGTSYRIRIRGAVLGQSQLTWNQTPTETEAPVADILWPLAGAYVRERASITARAFDRREVSRVDFYAGTTKVGSYGPPGYGQATVSVDTRTLPDGPTRLTAVAVDSFRNVGAPSPPVEVIVDNTAPQTTITAGPPASTTSRSASFSFAASEPVVERLCRLDHEAWFACAETLTIEQLADGPHTLDVRTKDRAGNLDLTHASRTWTVLGTEPEPSPEPTPSPDPELPPDPPPTATPTPTPQPSATPGTSTSTGGPAPDAGTGTGSGSPPPPAGPLSTVATSPGGDLQLSVTLPRTRYTLAALRRGVRVASGCSSACTLTGKLVLTARGTRTIARTSARGRAGRTVILRLRVPARHLKLLRRKGARLRLLVTARSAGEAATVRRGIRLRR
jgi:hypothetical protein